MENLEYLGKIKKTDEEFHKLCKIEVESLVNDNLEYKYRQTRALEIIAEELCKITKIKEAKEIGR